MSYYYDQSLHGPSIYGPPLHTTTDPYYESVADPRVSRNPLPVSGASRAIPFTKNYSQPIYSTGVRYDVGNMEGCHHAQEAYHKHDILPEEPFVVREDRKRSNRKWKIRVGSDEGERIHAAEDKERRPKYREDQAYHDRMRPRYNSYLDQEDEYEKRKRREQEENREESEEKQRKKGHGRSASRTPHHSTHKKFTSASAFTPREATLKDVAAYKKRMEGKKDKVEISENNRLEYWDPSEDPFFVIFGYIFDLQNGMKYIFNLASTHRQSEAMSNMVGDVWTHQQSEAMSNMVGDVWTQFILLQSRLTRSWEYLQWNDLDLPLSWRSREVEKHLHKIKKHLYKGDRILQKGREKIVTANEKAKPKNYDKEVFLFHLLGDEAFMKISTTTSIWHKVFVDKYSKALKIECKGKADGVA